MGEIDVKESERLQQRTFRLVPVTSLDTESQLAIRDIRNQPSVCQAMLSDHVVSTNEHLQWLASLKKAADKLTFALQTADGQLVGSAGISAWQQEHQTAAWGYYVGEQWRGSGIGMAMTCSFLDFVFDVLGLEKLNAEVIEGNELSLRHHERLRFEKEGFRRSNISRNGGRLGVHLFGMTAADWRERRLHVRTRYQALLEAVQITIDWKPAGQSLSPIDRIEEARARNNLNWMSILRLALEKSPGPAKELVSEIKKLDQEISGLTQEVINS